MNRIDQLKQTFHDGHLEQIKEMFRERGAEHSFKQLGQALLWDGKLQDFERLLNFGILHLKDGELEVLNLGLQLVPPGLPDSAWVTPPLCQLLEEAYKVVEAALEHFPEPLTLFRNLAMHRQQDAKGALDANQDGRIPGSG